MGYEFAGAEKMIQETFFHSISFRKKTTLTHFRISKYDAGQEIQIGDHEYSDVRK